MTPPTPAPVDAAALLSLCESPDAPPGIVLPPEFIARLCRELLALRQERDRLKRALLEAAAGQVQAQSQEVQRLRAALAPFARYAARVDPSAHPTNPIDDACPPVGGYKDEMVPRNAKPVPTIGDCRRAREALG